ncbi:MAG: glycosyltransferase family 4 protein [Treponema sp.]|nr:glycosyltransferase family 4 protein [Treponema sp.]
MKILYDSLIFDMQKTGGVSRYFVEIISRLKDFGIDYELPLNYSKNVYLQEESLTNLDNSRLKYLYENFLPSMQFRGKRKLWTLRNKFFYRNFISNRERDIQALKQQDFDIFHTTYYDPYFLDYIGKKPFVLTIYDMTHEKFPEMLLDIDTIRNKKLLAEKANKIIAISENTKQDIIDIMKIPESKIDVVYLGDSILEKKQQVKNEFGKYFLFTGNRNDYKNFYFMLIALSDFLKANPDVKIVCTGSNFTDWEVKLINELDLSSQVIHHFFKNNNEMYWLYHNAVAFIFPSYYEGFGIPILEAFSAECPVILADASCFREVADNGALYFDFKNKRQLIICCDKLLNDSSFRQEITTKGKQVLKKFSWEKTAEETVKIYKSILE